MKSRGLDVRSDFRFRELGVGTGPPLALPSSLRPKTCARQRWTLYVRPSDTSPPIQARMDAWYRSLTPTERGDLLREMWWQGRELQLAGLRARFPDESEAEIELRLAKRWLGPDLFARVMAHKKARGLD